MSANTTEGEGAREIPRAMAVAGIIFAILLTCSMILIRLALPATLGEVIGRAHRITISRSLIVGINLLPFAGIIFLWFIGVIRDYIGNREDRFFATVLLGSGLLFIAMLFVSAGIAGGLISSITTGINRSANTNLFYTGRAISYVISTVYATRMAGVFMFSTTMLTHRVRLIPRWLADLGFLLAIILLISVSRFEWIILLFPLWVLIFSFFILFNRQQR
ncbi:MAG TPA: hypothetical protein VHV83_08025 [Armatimonadota bacterium]|nr:hypothetical protein [Armatimonadota bacterium]